MLIGSFFTPTKAQEPLLISYSHTNLVDGLTITNLFQPPVKTVKIVIVPSEYVPPAPIVIPVVKQTVAPIFTVKSSNTQSPAILQSIKICESGGNYQAQNKHSTASGAYQFLDTSWHSYGGYLHAKDAPPQIQDEYALQYFRDNGTRPWISSQSCWG